MAEWLNQLAVLFGASRYAPFAICLSDDTAIVNLYLVLNLIIAGSGATIGGILVASRANVARVLRWVFFEPKLLPLFGWFIALTALAQGTMALTLYTPTYYLDCFVRVLAAGVGLATAIRTAKAFSQEKKLPSLVEALEIPMADPYSPRGVYPPSE